MELIPFQIKASTEVAEKCRQYLVDPLFQRKDKIVPFFQTLSAVTGSGKTLILADSIEQLRAHFSVEPIVLWLSKGRVVVSQTLHNLSEGKYSSLVKGFNVRALLECKPEDVENSAAGLLLVATVAKFNQKDKEKGDRKIFRVCLDEADQPLWNLLTERIDSNGRKRPFVIVYDEGHNLSDQQMELLLELGPDALIVASATMRIPEKLQKLIERLRSELQWSEDDLITTVKSADVVDSGLIKKHILLGGYMTPMETAINEMLYEMEQYSNTANINGLRIRPKAIYVSNTNALYGIPIKEDMARPFTERLARPILIWRHLVENCGIDPQEIAVYCDLKFDPKFPPPSDMIIFSGGDADFDNFVLGDFKHIIFNLSLQEGWDDPECSFAYIDKDMGSADQVTQVVGRVLRQPGAQHYGQPILNTAHFYVRTDEQGIFNEILTEIQKKIAADIPQVTLTVRKGNKGGAKPVRAPKKDKTVPKTQIDSSEAYNPIKKIVNEIIDFGTGGPSTIGKGGRIQVLQTIGTGEGSYKEWVEVEHSNPVTARWIFIRELQKRQPKAVHLCDIEHEKFDALIEYFSPAAEHIRQQAERVAEAYVKHSEIVLLANDHPYQVGSVPVDEAQLMSFKHSLHEGYSGLNGFELEFAEALDNTKKIWCRNPSQGAYGIPLLDHGKTRTFNPDFLVWNEKEKSIIAIDPKGDHLIHEAAARKLFHIRKIGEAPELLLRLITRGKWSVDVGDISSRIDELGFTVWRLKHGKLDPVFCTNSTEAVEACLRT